MSLEFQLRIERTPAIVEGALTFEAGATRAQASDPALHVYEHHGVEFGQTDPGALTSFYEDLIRGRPLPLTFITPEVRDVDTMVAISLFLHRDLAIEPMMSSLVAQVDLVHRRGLPLLAHVDEDLALFLRLLRVYLVPGLSRRDLGERLGAVVSWIRTYVKEGALPALGNPFADVQVLDRGTDGFVVAETRGDLLEGWVRLFAEGHLRGVLVRTEPADRRQVLAARKSGYCPFDFGLAVKLLNEVETAMGEPAGWRVQGDWLWGPRGGTKLLLPHMLEIFVRV